MKTIDIVFVNRRWSRDSLVAGDLICGAILDHAVALMKEREASPVVGQFYVLDLPLRGFQNLMDTPQKWISLSPGSVAVSELKPIIAVYSPTLDALVEQGPRGWFSTACGLMRGNDGRTIEIFFAVA